MHPIFNLSGAVIGFSGRIIEKDSKAPKYLNSPETVIYHKKDSMYGLFQAKEAMRRQKKVILVEGNIDVVSSAGVGVENIVCPLGTALTPEQLQLLKRYVSEVLFAFDTDTAGKKALLRSLELTEAAGLVAKAVNIGNYKDVDEMITANLDSDPQYWAKVVADSLEIPEYVIEVFQKDYQLSDPTQKEQFIDLSLAFVAKVRSEIKVDHYLQRLSLITATKYEVLVSELKKLAGGAPQARPAKATTSSSDEERPQLPAVKKSLKLSRQLAQLIVYTYSWKEMLGDPQAVRAIYAANLTQAEVEILDYALLGTVKAKVNDLAELKTEVATALSSNIKANQVVEDPQMELEKMLAIYVISRLDNELRRLKTKLNQADAAEAGSINGRIAKYAQKKFALDKAYVHKAN